MAPDPVSRVNNPLTWAGAVAFYSQFCQPWQKVS
jgi:hypothetical protein